MGVYEAIAARRTIRDFDGRPVEQMVLWRVLGAGLEAPSHNHLREWHFVLVRNARQREALVGFFFEERTEEEIRDMLDGWGMTDERQYAMYLDAIPKQVGMILSAGALLIPCFRQCGALLGEKKSLHELNAFASMWAVLENVLIAAASEGLFGVTKIISTPEEAKHVRTRLGIPNDYEIPCYLALGYPLGDAVRPKQLRIDAEERLHVDRWSE
jgi:nitroreductase